MREVYLAQSDTTIGLFCDDYFKLNKIKGREVNQACLIVLDSFEKLKKITRVPSKYKKMIRRTKKTSFIYPNKKAIRVSFDSRHNKFLSKFDFLYSTSANFHKQEFDYCSIKPYCDEIIDDCEFRQNKASSIYKINNQKMIKIR